MGIFLQIFFTFILGIVLFGFFFNEFGHLVLAFLISYLVINNIKLKRTISKLQYLIDKISKDSEGAAGSEVSEQPNLEEQASEDQSVKKIRYRYKENQYGYHDRVDSQHQSQPQQQSQKATTSVQNEDEETSAEGNEQQNNTKEELAASAEAPLLDVSSCLDGEKKESAEQKAGEEKQKLAASRAPVSSSCSQSQTTLNIDRPKSSKLGEESLEGKCDQLFDRVTSFVIQKVKDYFTSGNTIVRVGIIVLFFGVAFLLKYVSEHTQLPVELRYIAAACGGLALLVFGWRLRNKNFGYSLTLQGGGIGILYLTVFAALRISHILSPTATFALLVIIVVLASIISVLQNAPALAIISILGGFFAPIIASTGTGDFVYLFSYYLILNIGIAIIAWFKSWRTLNLIGFAFTFVIGLIWGLKYYQPEYYDSIQPFLIAYFLLYSFISIAFTIKQTDVGIKYIDSTLIFGTPIAAFGLQAAIVKNISMGAGISAAVIGAYYIVITYLLLKLYGSRAKLLLESFLAFGVGFLTLAIPLASSDGRITSASWAVEGVALLWIGLKQGRTLARIAGSSLILLGSAAFAIGLKFDPMPYTAEIIPFLNSDFIGVALITLSSFAGGLMLIKNGANIFKFEQQILCVFLIIYGYAWWIFGGAMQLRYFAAANQILAVGAFISFTALATSFYGYKKQMLLFFRLGCVSLLPGFLLAIKAILLMDGDDSLFINHEFIAVLILAISTLVISLYGHLYKAAEKIQVDSNFLLLILLYGIGMIIIIALGDLHNKLHFGDWTVASTVFCCLFFSFWGYISGKINWNWLRIFYLFIIPAAIFFMFCNITNDINLHENLGFVVFPLAISLGYYLLHNCDAKPQFNSQWLHFCYAVIFTAMVCWQFENLLQWIFEVQSNLLINSIWGIIPTMVLAATILHRNSPKWPVNNHKQIYTLYIPVAAMFWMLLWMLIINLSKPAVTSFGEYLPVINAYDITQIFMVVTTWAAYKTLFANTNQVNKEYVYTTLFVTVFALINFSLLRTLFYWFDIGYTPKAILDSVLAQTCISILWGICGMGIMILSSKKMWRPVWIAGAVIIGGLVIKLFVIDTSGIGTIERIVAFITVGIVLLITGYFAPVPPSDLESNEQLSNQSSKQSGLAGE